MNHSSKVEITESLRSQLISLGISFGFRTNVVEDCVQDALIKIWKNAEYFDSEKGKFTSWSGVILYRTILDNIKKKRPIVDFDLSDMFWVNPKVNQIETQVEIDHIEFYFRRVRLKFRKPMYLRMIGYSYKEISQMLGCSIGTIKSQIHRGRIELLELMNEG